MAGVIAGVANVVISAIARGPLGVSDDFVPITAGPIVMWTILGEIIGAVGWRLIVNTSAHSRALLNRPPKGSQCGLRSTDPRPARAPLERDGQPQRLLVHEGHHK